MNISDAIAALWRGERITRQGWNSKGMFVGLQTPTETSKMTAPYLYLCTVDGTFVPWTPSQTDVLAMDWSIVS